MSEDIQSQSSSIRRVVVALDASPCSRAVLRTAARISAALGAQLEGLFIEDERLLELSELPIAAEMRQPGGMRAFDRPLAERELRVVAQTVEEWAEKIAHTHNPAWCFRTERGHIASALMAAAGEDALLSLGRFSNPICTPHPSRVGSVTQRVLGEYRAPLLLLHQEIRPGQPILLTTSGEEKELPLVAMAVHLARAYDSPLAILAENPAAEAFLRAALDGNPLPVTFHRLHPGDLASQILAISQGRGGVILSHRREPALASLECAVILL